MIDYNSTEEKDGSDIIISNKEGIHPSILSLISNPSNFHEMITSDFIHILSICLKACFLPIFHDFTVIHNPSHPFSHLPSFTAIREYLFSTDPVRLFSPISASSQVTFPTVRDSYSFHHPLHRFLGTFIIECLKFPSSSNIIEGLLGDISGFCSSPYFCDNQEVDAKLIFDMIPFLTSTAIEGILLSAEIACGMWKRNGKVMEAQELNFSEMPFSRIYKDLDIFILQFCYTLQKSYCCKTSSTSSIMRDDMKNDESATKDEEEEESDSGVITFFSQLLSSFCLFDHMSGEEPKVLVLFYVS